MPIGFDKNNTPNAKKQAAHNGAASSNAKDTAKKTSAKPKPAATETEFDSDDDDFNIDTSKKKDKKLIYIAAGVLAVIVIGVAYTGLNKSETPAVSDEVSKDDSNQGTSNSDSSDDTDTDDTENQFVYDENGNPIYSKENNDLVDDNAIDPGAANYSESTKNKTTPKVYNADDYLKDINGVDIKATYNVVSRDYVYDYVSYVAKRGIIDDGMEIYWLEATYEGKKYRIQVPFYYFKDFSTEGVCRVQIEVLNIEGGGKVISYMQVVDNPSDDTATEE